MDQLAVSPDPAECTTCHQRLQDPGEGCVPCGLTSMPWSPWILSWLLSLVALWLVTPLVLEVGLEWHTRPPVVSTRTSAAMAAGFFLVARFLRRSQRWAYLICLLSSLVSSLTVIGACWVAYLAEARLLPPWVKAPDPLVWVLRKFLELAGRGEPLDEWLLWLNDRYFTEALILGLTLLGLSLLSVLPNSRAHFPRRWRPKSIVLTLLAVSLILAPVLSPVLWPFAIRFREWMDPPAPGHQRPDWPEGPAVPTEPRTEPTRGGGSG